MQDRSPAISPAAQLIESCEQTTVRLTAASYDALGDSALLATIGALSQHASTLQRQIALASASLARRSGREYGQAGLANRMGHTSPNALLQRITGGSRTEVATLLNTGLMLAQTEAADEETRLRHEAGLPDGEPLPGLGGAGPAEGAGFPASAAARPWFGPISDAVASGLFSLGVGDAIRGGLRAGPDGRLLLTEALRGPLGAGGAASAADGARVEPAEARAAREEALVAAVCAVLPELIRECARLTPELAFKEARAARDRADAAGVLARSEQMRRQQYFRAWERPDGMVAGSFLLEPENGALVIAVKDRLRHPRRAGVKFRSQVDTVAARAARGDLREVDEFTADGFVDLLRAGVSVDPDKILDDHRPCVTLHVQQESLTRGTDGAGVGFGIIESSNEAVPREAVEREICAGGSIAVLFNEQGQPLNLGRETRLFTRRQRIALAARDGGCMAEGCDRPVSWTEAHHIKHWQRDNGRTDIDDGILLCRYHHLLFHNQGWEVIHDGAGHLLIPPRSVDPDQTPRRLTSKSGLRRRPPVQLPDRLARPRTAGDSVAKAAAGATPATAGHRTETLIPGP
ncbi:HNH endonuclease signature motif containing protein [Microterricola pindariensis]|uniref:HNH nuclease domain-containing protein n=1 Tax=Microterricola pindariensis TaxID=478010 RepID=A0ABX5AVV6_9MICO|nr:HNH endonuclease signature motif containing protein [Microterricola pindariensis]PPL18791.1 hypothetical protein GY24_09365 [Microterricola pindariensis]